MRIKWFPAAIKDIDGIYEYYSKKNQRAATDLYNGILDDAERLSNNPYIAAIEPLLSEMPKSYRSLVSGKGKIKIIYHVKDDILIIVRIWDCRQNPEKLKKSLRTSV